MYRMTPGLRPSRPKPDLDKFPIGTPHALDERTEAQVAELRRLEELGFQCMRALGDRVERLDMDENIALFIRPKTGIISEFIRIERAIRQAIILQRELEGLRPPRVVRPPRVRRADSEDDAEDDLHERPDTATERDRAEPRDDWDSLDYKPVDEATRWIRQALGAAPPERDPFAPSDSGPIDSGPPEPVPADSTSGGPPAPPSPAAPASAASSAKPAPMGQVRAKLFRTTHFSPYISLAAPMAPHQAIHQPAAQPWQPPRGPP